MIVDNLPDGRAALRAALSDSRQVLGFTGAGVSTESGVPDFRSPNSPWMRHKPIAFETFLRDPAARVEAWRRKFAMDDLYAGAKPSRAHRAFAEFVKTGRMPVIVTQNIDGLHQAAGVPDDKVIELHGNGGYATCLSCGTRHELRDIRAALARDATAPSCVACGGVVKSATVSFGQAMPQEAMRRAVEAALACDLFLAVGSSLVVHPAASLPATAKRNGARLLIVNRDPTPLDSVADLVLRNDIGDLFEA